MALAVELQMGSQPLVLSGVGTYDQDKLNMTSLFMQNTGPSITDKWAGPVAVQVGRPLEASTAIQLAYPWAMQWSNNATSQQDWIFAIENNTAAIQRRVVLYTLDRITGVLAWKGYITIQHPTSGTMTVRALRMAYRTWTTGTVAVSGTAVTGTSTSFSTNGATCVGSRIGFGSTDPTQITTWYEVSAVGSDTGITLTSTAGTISAGTAYVIEDLMCIVAQTNGTVANSGIVLVKGLRFENFTSGGTTISFAPGAVDRLRACYYLSATSNPIGATLGGMGIQDIVSPVDQTVWLSQGTTTMQLFKFNIRAPLTVATGVSATAFLLATGVSATLTGTASQANNGRIATLNHGPGSGLACFYFTTTTRVYRTSAVSTILASSTTFLADTMQEVPPGGTNTFTASSLMNSLELNGGFDKFIIFNNNTTVAYRNYVTAYNATGAQMDRVWGLDNRQLNHSISDSSLTPVITAGGVGATSVAWSGWSEGGMLYLVGLGTLTTNNLLYAIPMGVDWEYAATTGHRMIFPRLLTPNCDSFKRAWVNTADMMGGATTYNLGLGTEPLRLYYRVTGISDNSGTWTLMNNTMDLSAVPGTASIQFMAEFRMIGTACIPDRIYNIGVTYNALATLDNYQLSTVKSVPASKQFAWRFATAFGGTVPGLKVRLYDAITGSLLVTDTTASPSGTWQKTTDGTTWGSYNTTDKANETTYIRYTPSSLADNVYVRPVLTLA